MKRARTDELPAELRSRVAVVAVRLAPSRDEVAFAGKCVIDGCPVTVLGPASRRDWPMAEEGDRHGVVWTTPALVFAVVDRLLASATVREARVVGTDVHIATALLSA